MYTKYNLYIGLGFIYITEWCEQRYMRDKQRK
jgi:hypothetical protein